MDLRCATMKNKAGGKYVFCSGANKAKPKGKTTANKKKKSIPAGMAKKSKPVKRKMTGPLRRIKINKNKNKLVPMRPTMNQTVSNRPIMSLRRSGGGY